MMETINAWVANAADWIFGWILFLPRDLSLFTVAVLTSASLSFVRKWTTDQEWLHRSVADEERQCQLIKEAKKQRLALSTYHNRHWDGCILKAVDEIREKKVIGDVVRIEAHMGGFGKPGDWWRTSKSISGGIMYDWGVHLLEYSLQILGGDSHAAI